MVQADFQVFQGLMEIQDIVEQVVLAEFQDFQVIQEFQDLVVQEYQDLVVIAEQVGFQGIQE